MNEYIAFDSHKHYTIVERADASTGRVRQCRIEHAPGNIRTFLARHGRQGTPVALEAIGNWYWIADEIEEAGFVPRLVHPRKAKLMMGMINKTDKLDVHGLNRLQRNGTLPTVWIPPAELRDRRELTRTRIVMVRQRTRLKNRIHATLAKYAFVVEDASDVFGRKARPALERVIGRLPPHSAYVTEMLLKQVDKLDGDIGQLEKRLDGLLEVTPEMKLLATLPGIGTILSATIAWEVGDVHRFASAERLASYAGTTPRVHASGGKVRYGKLRPDVNRYLKWAFAEAGNSVALNHTRCPDRHVSELYLRLSVRCGHAKAIGAVARHLAEACFHVLMKQEPYRDPAQQAGRAREA